MRHSSFSYFSASSISYEYYCAEIMYFFSQQLLSCGPLTSEADDYEENDALCLCFVTLGWQNEQQPPAVQRKWFSSAAFCLGVLCFLMLSAIIILSRYCKIKTHPTTNTFRKSGTFPAYLWTVVIIYKLGLSTNKILFAINYMIVNSLQVKK